MPNEQKVEIEYQFEDLRRNDDPVPDEALKSVGVDLTDDEPEEKSTSTGLDEDGTYDPVRMTKAMRKRLAKQRLAHQKELDEIRAEGNKRIGDLEKALMELKDGRQTEDDDAKFNADRDAVQKEIVDAMELGDSDKVAKLTVKLTDLTTDAKLKRLQLERTAAERTKPDETDTSKEPVIKPKARLWLNEQADWWDDEDFKDARKYVIEVDEKLQKAGYSPDEDSFYLALEDYVGKKFPDVINSTKELYGGGEEDDDLVDDDDDLVIPPKVRRRRVSSAPVQAPRGRSGVTKRTSKTKTLSASRVANMKMFGLDPNNAADVEAYMREI